MISFDTIMLRLKEATGIYNGNQGQQEQSDLREVQQRMRREQREVNERDTEDRYERVGMNWKGSGRRDARLPSNKRDRDEIFEAQRPQKRQRA